jgi:outer membrane protein
MKKSFFFLILMLLLISKSTYAQKFGYIDTEFITSKMPDYQKVQQKLDGLTQQWISEIALKNDEVDKLEKEFKLEEVLLTEDLRQQRLLQIKVKDQEAKSFQNKIFGVDGDLFKAKQAALKPILDEISKAVEKVVRQKRLDFLFDKGSDGLALIYTNPVHDYSDYILEELGIELDPNIVDKATENSKPEKKTNN